MTGSELATRGTAALPAYTDADYSVSDGAAQRLIRSVPANTARGYKHDWDDFAAWCAAQGRTPLPATSQTLLEYVNYLIEDSDYDAPKSIERAIGCIRSRHRRSGHKGQPDSEAALNVLRDYKREWADLGNRVRQATPVTVPALRAMVATCDLESAAGVRDRALLLIGFAIMGRESEVSQLDIADLREDGDKGMTVFIRYSKTDQEAKGAKVQVPYGDHEGTCPVRAWRDWLSVLAGRGIVTGALFRPIDRHGRIGGEPDAAGRFAARLTGPSVSQVVTRRARLAGLSSPEGYSGHSLRAGGATAAYAAGAPVSEIAKHGRWRENSPVVLGYIRAVDGWKNNPMKGIGL